MRALSILVAASVLASAALAAAPAPAKEQTFSDDEQRFVLMLCEVGNIAALIQTNQGCNVLRQKIGTLPAPAGQGAPPAEAPVPPKAPE